MSPQLLFAFTTVEGKILARELSLDLVPSSITSASGLRAPQSYLRPNLWDLSLCYLTQQEGLCRCD